MKKKVLVLLSFVLAIVMSVGVLTACGSKVTVEISKTTLELVEGKSNTLTAKASDGSAITWSSSDEEVATVEKGKVTAVKEGSAKITAKAAGGGKATCQVTVIKEEFVFIRADGANVSASIEMTAGGTKTLSAVGTLGSTAFTWSSSDTRVATVNGNGVVTAGEINGEAEITAAVTAHPAFYAKVKVVVTGGKEFYELENTGEEGAINTNRWTYWTETWVTATTAEFLDGELTFAFENNASDSPSFFYMTQLFYHDSSLGLTAGTRYRLSFKMDSDAEGWVTINGNAIKVKQGTHDYVTYFNYNNIAWSMQGAVNGMLADLIDATLKISDYTWLPDGAQEQLTAPEFEYDSQSGVITFTDEVNDEGSVGEYRLYFYDNQNVSQGFATVVSGEVVDLSDIPNGTYTAKLVAVGANAHYMDSLPSSTSVQIIVDSPTTNLKEGGEHDSYMNPDIWYEWHDRGWNGSTVTMHEKYIDNSDGSIHLSFEIDGSNIYNQAVHLYKNISGLTKGNPYKLSFDITSDVECTIDVCGTMFDLNEGSNHIDAYFYHPQQTGDWQGKPIGSTIRIFFNDNGSFVLSGFEVTPFTPSPLATPEIAIDDDTGIVTITDNTNDAKNVEKYVATFYEGQKIVATVEVQDGEPIDLSRVGTGEYTVKIKAISAGLPYTDSAESAGISYTVENDNPKYDMSTTFGGGEARENPGIWGVWAGPWNWTEWKSNATITSAVCEVGTGTITIEFTLEGGDAGNTWGLQINYVNPNYVGGTRYYFDVVASVDMNIQVESGDSPATVLKAGVAKTGVQGGADDSFYIQINVGAKQTISGTITISNVVWR